MNAASAYSDMPGGEGGGGWGSRNLEYFAGGGSSTSDYSLLVLGSVLGSLPHFGKLSHVGVSWLQSTSTPSSTMRIPCVARA